MKALTIWQPWASLIMAGAKPWEWRGWRVPSSMIGRRIVIHAAVRRPSADDIQDIRQMLRVGDSSLLPIAADLLEAHAGSWPLACGLGTAVLGIPIPALVWAARHCKPGFDSDRVDQHQFAWPLTDIQRFDAPIPMRGAQGFWDWPEVLAA